MTLQISLTSNARVATAIEKSAITELDAEGQAWIAKAILGYSMAVQKALCRHTKAEARTEQFPLGMRQRLVKLPAYPVSAITSVKVDLLREFGTGTEVESDDYYLDTERGLLHFDLPQLVEGEGILQVVWTGGMGANTDTFVAAYPDLADAIDTQIVYHWRRRQEPGGNMTVGAGGRTYTGELAFIQILTDAVERHRRMGVGRGR